MSRDQRRWTAAEDDLLREGYRWQAAGMQDLRLPHISLRGSISHRPAFLIVLIGPSGKGHTINWSEIAKRIPGRSNKDCRKRYFNEVSGCLKKVTHLTYFLAYWSAPFLPGAS
jgi:Myb-like DNA-binding domain